MADMEVLTGQLIDVLKSLESTIKDRKSSNDISSFSEKLDQMIVLQEKQVHLLKILTGDRCTCGKNKIRKKELKEGKEKKQKKEKKDH